MRAMLIAAVLLLVPIHSGAAGPLRFNEPFVESIDESRRVSGDALVGVVYEPRQPSNLQSLSAVLGSFDGALKLYISTADGRYYAEIGYDVSEPSSGVTPLVLPESTQRWFAAQPYTYKTAAVLLREADNRRRVFPVIWNQGPAGRSALAHVNTERASGFVRDYTIGKRVACTPHGHSVSMIFDQVCRFPTALFDRERVEIERKDGTRVLSPIYIRVYR